MTSRSEGNEAACPKLSCLTQPRLYPGTAGCRSRYLLDGYLSVALDRVCRPKSWAQNGVILTRFASRDDCYQLSLDSSQARGLSPMFSRRIRCPEFKACLTMLVIDGRKDLFRLAADYPV